MLARPRELRPEAQAQLDQITRLDDTLAQARALTHSFLDLIRHHSGDGLDTWLKDARVSTVQQFHTFARSLERDKAAILGGLTLPYSTGPVEGHINRLKPDLSPSVWPSQSVLLTTPLLAGGLMVNLFTPWYWSTC
jgi:transposase